MPFFPQPINCRPHPKFVTKYSYFQLDMSDCQSVPSRDTPPFRRPITLLARGLFRPRTVLGLLNAVKIELNDASVKFWYGAEFPVWAQIGHSARKYLYFWQVTDAHWIAHPVSGTILSLTVTPQWPRRPPGL